MSIVRPRGDPVLLLPHENERLSARLPGNNGRNVDDTCSNDDRLNVTRQRSDTREGIERAQYLASMRSTDRAGTRDRVHAADKRTCTRARVLSLSNTLTAHSARRSGIVPSFHELVPSPRPPLTPSLPFLPLPLPPVATRSGRETDSFVRVKSESLSSPFPILIPTCSPWLTTTTTTPLPPCQRVQRVSRCFVWQPTSSRRYSTHCTILSLAREN